MAQSQYSLSWNSYKSNISNGFSSLQQNGEFVDMTIAADGHMVKVHQVLVALASPYLKDLIGTAPSQHPVVFLNNVSQKVLSYLLEYIYTGEVVIPEDSLQHFVKTAQALHVKGLENISESVRLENDNTTPAKMTGVKRKATTTIESGILSMSARKKIVKSEDTVITPKTESPQTRITTHTHKTPQRTPQEFPDFEDSGPQDQDSDDGFRLNEITSDADMEKPKSVTSKLLFTVSIRGSLQVILNRYIYNIYSIPTKAGLRKWRCVDFRHHKCNAFLITRGNAVVNRANPHNHPFHDKKIISKTEKNSVFSALTDVEAYREKEKEIVKEKEMDKKQEINKEKEMDKAKEMDKEMEMNKKKEINKEARRDPLA